MDTGTRTRIRALLREDIDWTSLLRIATRHQLAPLIGFNLCTTFADACPATVIDEFRSCMREITARNLFLARELIRLLEVFESRAIPVIPFKGPLLASTAYGHLGLRAFCDLDVLVDRIREYRVHVPEVLRSDGWTMIGDNGYECTFANASGDIHLDVHHALTPQRLMPLRLNFGDIWRRCTNVAFIGTTARTPAPPDLLIMLCVQLAKDTGDERMSPRLIKVCDIAQLIDRHADLDWPLTLREARRLGALRMLFVGVGAARKLFGTALPNDVLQRCQAIPRFDSLVSHVEERVFFGRVGRFSRPELLSRATWHAETRERALDRSSLRSLVHRVIVPIHLDYAFVKLPATLFPLYFAVKPVRLARNLCRTIIGKVQARRAGGTC